MNPSQRLLPIDSVRGTAMLFVRVSHISYFFIVSSPETSALLRALGFFATPNFLLMSGLACGYQLSKFPSSATAMRIFDRGRFVLLVGHFVVSASLTYIVLPGTAFEHVVITDTIGLMLCTAPVLRYLPARQPLPTGTAILLLSSLIGLTWRPTSTVGATFGGILFGVDVTIFPDAGWITATLPLFGFFLIGVGIGNFVSEFRVTGGRSKAIWTRLALVGILAFALGEPLEKPATLPGRRAVRRLTPERLAESRCSTGLSCSRGHQHPKPSSRTLARRSSDVGRKPWAYGGAKAIHVRLILPDTAES